MKALSPEYIQERLTAHPGWRLEGIWLARDLQFEDFKSAWQFMDYVAGCAEAQDHHPNWYNVYSIVQIRLSTHDAAGVTDRDFHLVSSIDEYLSDAQHTDLTPTPIFRN